jgi:hypothetical protein
MTDTASDKLRPLLQQLIFGFFPSAVLSVAARLRIPDLVAGDPKSSDELASATSADPPSLYRLLRALAYLGVLEETEPRRFGLTDLGALLRSDVPDSMWATTQLFCGEGVWRSWGDLMAGVQTGRPSFERGIGLDPFAEFADDPEASRNFNQAMSEGLQGILFDTGPGMAEANERIGAAGVDDRCQLMEGDFFESVPEGADAYIMKSVIHDWDDDRCVTILENCRRAMDDGGKVLIVEPVLPPIVKPSFARLGVIMSDLNMLLNTGGRERTEDEFASILRAAGLELTNVFRVPKPSAMSIIEGAPG